MIVFKIIRRN